MAPYAVEVYPTFRFDYPETKAEEPACEQTTAVPTPISPAPVGLIKTPMKLTDALEKFKSLEVTPAIGKEFPKANLAEWLHAPNADELIRDLAVTVSQRGVVFFRAQDDLTSDLQKTLCQKMGELTGKPADSNIHIHPPPNTSEQDEKHQAVKKVWHSDISYEAVPSDYTIFKLTDVPKLSHDTIWASGYELYNRFSPPYQKLLESLTATHATPFNSGTALSAEHPVIRTNPVTGRKSIYAIGHHVQQINGLNERESKHLLEEFVHIINDNHDLQVRFRWSQNDLAIWDNRSTYHTTIYDYDVNGLRIAQRCVGIGERPFHDPASTSRREAEGEE